LHSKAHVLKSKLPVRVGKRAAKKLEEAQSADNVELGKTKRSPEWFEIDGFMFRLSIKLNPAFISKVLGSKTFFVPFLAFSDPCCDSATRELAEILGVIDPREWIFKLADLEVEPTKWLRSNPKAGVSTVDVHLDSVGKTLLHQFCHVVVYIYC
jgi:hypothetical protein